MKEKNDENEFLSCGWKLRFAKNIHSDGEGFQLKGYIIVFGKKYKHWSRAEDCTMLTHAQGA